MAIYINIEAFNQTFFDFFDLYSRDNSIAILRKKKVDKYIDQKHLL
jgi:hypothetical protein